MEGVLLAIDPANELTGFCFMDMETYKPLYFAKEENEIAKKHMLEYCLFNDVEDVAIEMIASYGMAVGASTFQTCVWIGRFQESFESIGLHVEYIYRKEEKMCICGQMKAKDSNIRRALIDRFAKFDLENGKGTKANPDTFYGFKADIWAAFAVGTTWLDKKKGLYIP